MERPRLRIRSWRSWRVALAGLVALGIEAVPTGVPAADRAGPQGGSAPACLTEVPDDIADALMNRMIAELGQAAQSELLVHLLARGDLDEGQRSVLARFASLDRREAGAATVVDLKRQPGSEQAFVEPLALPLVDYRWFAVRATLDEGTLCPRLDVKAPADCAGNGSDIHNLVVLFLRNRQGLCGGPVVWTPGQGAHARIRTVAAIVASAAYYGTLESWLENGRNESFRLPGNFFTLLYMDYLRVAFSHRQINFALSEFLARRTDLRARYPGLEPLRVQLGRLKDLTLIE